MTSEPEQPDTPDSAETSSSQDELDAVVSKSDLPGDASPEDAPAQKDEGEPGTAQASESESQDDAGGDTEFSQADIDALMNSATDAEASSSETEEAPGGEVSFSQADIDALLGGGDSTAGAESEEAAEPARESAPEVDTRLDTMGRPFDEFAAAMQAAIDDESSEKASAASTAPASSPPTPPPQTEPLPLSDFSASPPVGSDAHRVSMLHDVKLGVKIELGRTQMLLEDVLRIDEGSVVELDKLAGDPVDVYANDRLVARGEVLILNDNFCVRISEVVTQDPHRVAT